MEDFKEAIKERARPLIARYQQNFVNLYKILNVVPKAGISEIFTAYKAKRNKNDSTVDEAFFILSSSFYRTVYDSAFRENFGDYSYSQDTLNSRSVFQTQRRRKKQTFAITFLIGFILDILGFLILLTMGNVYLSLIIFAGNLIIWMFFSWMISYLLISNFDKADKNQSSRIRFSIWIEPSLELAKYEVICTYHNIRQKLLTNYFALDEQFDFSSNSNKPANNIVLHDYWSKGIIIWKKKAKVLVPIENVASIVERQ